MAISFSGTFFFILLLLLIYFPNSNLHWHFDPVQWFCATILQILELDDKPSWKYVIYERVVGIHIGMYESKSL